MNQLPGIFLFLFLFQTYSFSSFGQRERETNEENQLVLLEMLSGDTFLGEVVWEDYQDITIRMRDASEITILKKNITSFEYMDYSQVIDGKYWVENTNDHRYFFSTSGYSLDKGEGYYQNYALLFNAVGYGISDRITLEVAAIPFTFGSGLFASTQVKYAFPIVEDKLHSAIVVNYTHGLGDQYGIGYGVLTYGSKDHHITIGAGYGLSDRYDNSLIFGISGMTRIWKKFCLVSENWLIPDETYGLAIDPVTGQFILGGRIRSRNVLFSLFGRYFAKRVIVEIGIAGNLLGGGGIPMGGVVIPFFGPK